MLSPLAIHSKHKGLANPDDALGRPSLFLGDLGKATLRGVRKCEKCGTLNGTRGLRCKNTLCDQVFKTSEKKKPVGPEASKLLTDPSIQVYSVRSKTGDARGFVQLPIVQDMEGNPATVDVTIVCNAAKCYVETCARSRNETLEPCFHIKSSVEALDEATPLEIETSTLSSILNSMDITAEMRQQIWSLTVDKPGPLVQRITKNVMAVKTPVTVKHQLGYLHFTFLPHKKDDKRFVCSCKDAKSTIVTMSDADGDGESRYKIQRCIHFYSCVCAFSSDEELAKEFQYVLEADSEIEKSLPADQNSMSEENSAAIEAVTKACNDELIEVEYAEMNTEDLVGEDELTQELSSPVTQQSHSSKITYTVSQQKPVPQLLPSIQPARKRAIALPVSHVGPEIKRFRPPGAALIIKPPTNNPNSSNVTQSFMQWLQTVTERINLTMHYSLPGNPKPLVFYIPQAFWDCIMARLSSCSPNKRLLPSQTCTVIRTQIPPLGTFAQFSWYLTDLSHVRKVFDSPQVALLVSKYYDRAPDGSYSLSNTPRVQVDTGSGGAEPSSPPPTRQTHEYKTFLRVGQQGNNHSVIPFILDWIPDVFPLTHTGELSITFQYSHMVDGLSPAVDDDMVQQVIESGTASAHEHNVIITV